MQPQLFFGQDRTTQKKLAILVGVIATLAAASALVYPSNYAPVIVLGAVLGLIVVIAWMIKPVLALYAALFVVLLPTGVMPALTQSTINRSMTVVAFAMWLLGGLLIRRQKIYWNGAAFVILAFIAWSFITMYWAPIEKEARDYMQVYTLRFILFLFMIPNQVRTKKDLDGLMLTLALNGWALMGFSIYSLIQEGYTPGSRFQILAVNENDAGVLSLVTFLGILWTATQTSRRHKTLKMGVALIFFLMMLALVTASGSRGSFITLILVFVAFWFWKPFRFWTKLGVVLMILALVFTPSIFVTIIERFSGETADSISPLGGREVLWQAAWRMISDHPFRGVGIGNAPFSILPYLDTFHNAVGKTDGVSVHSPIFVIWGETGLPGIILYLGIWVTGLIIFIRQFFRFRAIDPNHPFMPYFALVSSVMLGYMASWFKGGGMEMAFSYFYMIALMVLPAGMDIETVSAREEPEDNRKTMFGWKSAKPVQPPEKI
jgi:O-antigen ligase